MNENGFLNKGEIISLVALVISFVGNIIVPILKYWKKINISNNVLILSMFIIAIIGLLSFIIFFILNRNKLKYTYTAENGIIWNGTIRNLTVRADTLFIILTKILEGNVSDDIYKLGYNVGYDFGTAWNEELRRKNIKFNKNLDKLKKWSEYDNNAGWGVYNFSNLHLDNCTGTITVKNSFLSSKSIKNEKNLCHFLAGYFEGVLLASFEIECKIICDEKCNGKTHANCVFKVSPKH